MFLSNLSDEKVKEYTARVTSGGVFSCTKKFLISALARDLGKNITRFLSIIDTLSKAFNADIVVFENDSIDGTDNALKAYSQVNSKFYCISTKLDTSKNEQDKSLKRRKDMARYRNFLLEFIGKNFSPDYYLLIDSDIGGISIEGLYHSLSFNNWDCMGSNGLYFLNKEGQVHKYYYDTWAYRDYGSWEDRNVNLLDLKPGDNPYEVFSAFGGAALYKWSKIKDLRYNETDCDHVTLNKQLIERGGRIYCNPSQIIIYNEINEQLSNTSSWTQINNKSMEK